MALENDLMEKQQKKIPPSKKNLGDFLLRYLLHFVELACQRTSLRARERPKVELKRVWKIRVWGSIGLLLSSLGSKLMLKNYV